MSFDSYAIEIAARVNNDRFPEIIAESPSPLLTLNVNIKHISASAVPVREHIQTKI